MVFPAALGPLFTYQPGDAAYTALPSGTAALSGRGYWADVGQPTTVLLTGPAPASVALPAPAGQWLLVGNPSAQTPVRVLGADLLLGYDPGQGAYGARTTLAPGQGAWALRYTGGTLTITP
jgi:hypothetical protein